MNTDEGGIFVGTKKTIGISTLAALLALSPAAVTAHADVTVGKGQVKEKPHKAVIDKALHQAVEQQGTVRVIIELEQEPTIIVAKNRGQLYKQLRQAERQKLEQQVEAEQQVIQQQVEQHAASVQVLENFTTIFNGFSAEVQAKDVNEIAKTPGVKAVYASNEYEAPQEKPQMAYSKELVQAQQAWHNYGVKGEGMVVAVIDSGVDPTHKDFILSDATKAEISKDEVQTLITQGAVHEGAYFTEKVPFGYNYMDGNTEIVDYNAETGMHGMHVAGTVGANGDEENGGIKGVAPEAQILAMKVFGNDPAIPTTYSDIYIKAIDDAIKLGADVINMSLGSTAGYVDENSAESQAITRATDSGVLVAISAGNSNMYGSGYFYPLAENPDYGLVGSPSVSNNSLSVASFENSQVTAYSFAATADGQPLNNIQYLTANDVSPLQVVNEPTEVVLAGFGTAEDLAQVDVSGKIALISRGGNTFVEKALHAQNAGAKAVLIYNNTVGTINMASDPAITIPYMSISQEDGLALKAAIDAGQKVEAAFNGDFITMPNELAGKMSDFSSWGTTPNLDFKPEITAPGGNIFSTLNNNEYGLNSGTSMAAPHVAGGAALLFERIDEEFGVTGTERVTLAKQLLMNTAKPVELSEGEYVSPRRQGAGLMQLANALENEVIITSTATGEGKVALREIEGESFTFTLQAKNYGDEAKTYDVDFQLQVDALTQSSGFVITAPNIIGSDVVTDTVDVDVVDQITVPANGTTQFTVTADISALSDYKQFFTNGFYVDGFVTLEDPQQDITGNPDLAIPVTGFNGEWDDAPIFDRYAWDEKSYWGYTALADDEGNFISGGGDYDMNRFGFSPNGDGVRDRVIPVFSLLRNAKALKAEVVDEDGNVVRTLRTAEDLRKHYTNTAPQRPYTFSDLFAWDGFINGQVAQDGQYTVRLRAVIDFDGAEWQSLDFPVQVDTQAPTANVSYANGTVSLTNVADSGTGADYWQVFVDGAAVSDLLPMTTTTFALDATNKDVQVHVTDVARNTATFPVQTAPIITDTKKPIVSITTPDLLEALTTKNVTVTGTIQDQSDIATVTVNGEQATFTNTSFTHTLTFKKDGVYDIKAKATDVHGNFMEVGRKVLIDTTKPTLSIKNNYKKNTKNATETVNVTIGDNYDAVRLTVNGDEKWNKSQSVNDLKAYKHTLAIPVSLAAGKNELTFEVTDIAGNVTTQTITITRK